MRTLLEIFKENWEWRGQIWGLAVFDLVKRARGAALGYAWLFVRPAIYIFVFWFALEIGLRAGAQGQYPPYIIWLAAGLMPWFFMQDVLSTGSNALRRYTYLVNKIKFPLSGISSIYTGASMILEVGLIIGLLVMYVFAGLPFDVYLLQIPIILVLMYVFWDCFSIWTSMLSAISKDFANLVKAMVQPLFWLSGIIFNVSTISIEWIRNILLFDPVYFFCTAMRDAVYYKTWFWEDTTMCLVFAGMFVAQLIVMIIVYRKSNKVVPDVL